jgi:hypothetical protein
LTDLNKNVLKNNSRESSSRPKAEIFKIYLKSIH